MEIIIKITNEDLQADETVHDAIARYLGNVEPRVTMKHPALGAPYGSQAGQQKDEPFIPTPNPVADEETVDAEEEELDDQEMVQRQDQEDANTPPPPPGAAAELDAFGVPWCADIHAGSKSKMNSGPRKGGWTKRRGLSEEEFKQKTEELLAKAGGFVPGGSAPGADEGDADTAADAPFLPGGDAPQAQTDTPPPAPAPTPAPQQQQPAAGGVVWSVPLFLQTVGSAKAAKTLDPKVLEAVLSSYGLKVLPEIALPENQPKMAEIAAALGLA